VTRQRGSSRKCGSKVLNGLRCDVGASLQTKDSLYVHGWLLTICIDPDLRMKHIVNSQLTAWVVRPGTGVLVVMYVR
jgi:hypothetical protein